MTRTHRRGHRHQKRQSRAGRFFGTVLILGIAVLVACSALKQGPAGTVVGRDRTPWTQVHTSGTSHYATTTYSYHLTTRDSDGKTHTFEVPSSAYDHCFTGSAYPGCVTN